MGYRPSLGHRPRKSICNCVRLSQLYIFLSGNRLRERQTENIMYMHDVWLEVIKSVGQPSPQRKVPRYLQYVKHFLQDRRALPGLNDVKFSYVIASVL